MDAPCLPCTTTEANLPQLKKCKQSKRRVNSTPLYNDTIKQQSSAGYLVFLHPHKAAYASGKTNVTPDTFLQ